jgi:hypothetical protein
MLVALRVIPALVAVVRLAVRRGSPQACGANHAISDLRGDTVGSVPAVTPDIRERTQRLTKEHSC